MFSIDVDWSENYNGETGEERFNLQCPNIDHHEKYGSGWETKYEATETHEGKKCTPYEGCPCCEDDSGYLAPMMNYAYPLEVKQVDQEIQVKIASETNCVLVEENSTGTLYLTLTGGGMDLSPSIAYAFFLAQKWLPMDLLQDLKAGWCKDSLGRKEFKKLRQVVKEQTAMEARRFREIFKEWAKPIKAISQ